MQVRTHIPWCTCLRAQYESYSTMKEVQGAGELALKEQDSWTRKMKQHLHQWNFVAVKVYDSEWAEKVGAHDERE